MKKLLKSGSVVIVLGAGGVGKTTIAAALGLAGAQAGHRTGVITVDPARRLRDALGMPRLGAKPTSIDPRRLRRAGLDPQLQFFAMMHDTKATWDGLVERFVEAPEARKRIVENPFYCNLTRNFAGAENYASVEQLYSLHETGRLELEVVDTPPAVQAFAFIEAHEHLIRLLGSPSARFIGSWRNLKKPAGLNLMDRLARRIVAELEKFAGVQPLSAIADFFADAGDSLEAIVARMRSANALLRSDAVSFVLVTTPESDRLQEAASIVRDLHARRLRLAAVVVNRVCDERFIAPELGRKRRDQTARYRRAIGELQSSPGSSGDPRSVTSLFDFLQEYVSQQEAARARVAGFISGLPGEVEKMLVPEMSSGAIGLEGLADIARVIAKPRP